MLAGHDDDDNDDDDDCDDDNVPPPCNWLCSLVSFARHQTLPSSLSFPAHSSHNCGHQHCVVIKIIIFHQIVMLFAITSQFDDE